MIGNGKPGTRFLQNGVEMDDSDLEKAASCDVYRDLTNLSSQVQMMSDSLAACKLMSKCRPLRKTYSVKGSPQPDSSGYRTPEVLLSEEKPPEDRKIVSFMVKEMLDAPQEDTWTAVAKGTSRVQMYLPQEVDTGRMVDVIRRDLKTLVAMAPSVALLATALSDTILHYKGCVSCRRKISSSLPCILNRIQNLVKYLSKKKEGKYRWPNDYSYLRLRGSQQPTGPKRTWKLETAEAVVLPEDIPGLQLLLEVKTKKTKKRFWERVERLRGWESSGRFSVVVLREVESEAVVVVLVGSVWGEVRLEERREGVAVREGGWLFPVVFAYPVGGCGSVVVVRGVGRVSKDPVGGKPLRSSNEKKPFSPRGFLTRVPEIVGEFLEEAEKQRMYDQKVQSLDAGVKGLRAVMAELERNQALLGKVLLEKGIYSPQIVRLTNPEMMEKECEVVKKAEMVHTSGSKRGSLEALQVEVDSLRHKCGLKNRLIGIILKGLESDIPKEWWEKMVEYVFDESKPIEDFDAEKVTEMVEQAARLPRKGGKASKNQKQQQRSERQTSEEELKLNGIVGADVEKKESKAKDDSSASDSPETSITKLENQVSVLNIENERLWNEVHDLKALLKSSANNFQDRRPFKQPSSSMRPTAKVSGKTINLTIQIVDKDQRRLRNGFPGGVKLSEMSIPEETEEEVKGVAVGGFSRDTLTEEQEEEMASEEGAHSFRSKDHQHLEKTSSGEERRLKSVLRERSSGSQVVATPRPSVHEMKPVLWLPSRYEVPEVSDGRRGGPSGKIDVAIPQKPSLMELAENPAPGMFGAMANERELQTIPENENGPSSGSSKGVTQAIQLLRTRVRSMHKDVTVLKSKNDRIDKLLDRLVDDAVENSESFEEIENDLNRFKDRLG